MSEDLAGLPASAHLVAALSEAVEAMDVLRRRCPWDAEQTHASLAPYAIEEAHEVAEAAESGDALALREELGDLLLQVLFHARVADERPRPPHGDGFDLADIAVGLTEKLRRRHPHVFSPGDDLSLDVAGVEGQWERIKAAERAGTPGSVLTGVPAALPSLARAQKVLRRARRAGIAVGPTFGDDLPAGDGDGDAAAQARPAPDPATCGLSGEIGAELLAIVARAEGVGVDAEAALRAQVRGIVGQVRASERSAAGQVADAHAASSQESG